MSKHPKHIDQSWLTWVLHWGDAARMSGKKRLYVVFIGGCSADQTFVVAFMFHHALPAVMCACIHIVAESSKEKGTGGITLRNTNKNGRE
jgi:hypothetical protein